MHYLQFSFLLFISFSTIAQSKEQVMTDHLDAVKQSFWENIPTVEAIGTFRYQKSDEVNGIFKYKAPGMWKFESLKNKTVFSYNGTIAWSKNHETNNQVVLLEKDMTLILSSLAYFGSPLMQYEQRELEFRGFVNVDKLSCYWFVYEKENMSKEYFLAKETGFLYKTIISHKNVKETKEFSFSYLNYRNFSGIPYPTFVQVRSTDIVIECVMNDILLGGGLSNQIFDLPQK